MSAKVLPFDAYAWPPASPCHLIAQILAYATRKRDLARFGKVATPAERREALEAAYDAARVVWRKLGRAKAREHLLSQGERYGLAEATLQLAGLECSLESAWTVWLRTHGAPAKVLLFLRPIDLPGEPANDRTAAP